MIILINTKKNNNNNKQNIILFWFTRDRCRSVKNSQTVKLLDEWKSTFPQGDIDRRFSVKFDHSVDARRGERGKKREGKVARTDPGETDPRACLANAAQS